MALKELEETDVETLVSMGNKVRGDNFRINVPGCPLLSQTVVTCDPPFPANTPVEVVGQGGVKYTEKGKKKTGESFTFSYQDSQKGVVLKEIKDWQNSDEKKKVRVYGDGELGTNPELDITYLHCWVNFEEAPASFDAEANTSSLKFTITMYYSLPKWTNSK